MSFYPRLPDELKLMIWEEAIIQEYGGVHHFKIGFERPRVYQQTLTVYPHRDNWRDDMSSWVDLWRLSVASRISWDLVERKRANRVVFWQKLPNLKLREAALMPDWPAVAGKTPQEEMGEVKGVPSDKIPNPTQAFVDGDKDIVCFTIVGSDFRLGWLRWANNHHRFQHLTRVAFNLLYPVARPCSWITHPLKCFCPGPCWARERANFTGFCPEAMDRILRVFENLQHFYFIIPIMVSRLRKCEFLPRGTKRERGGQAVQKTSAQMVTEAMDKFRAIAQEKGLSVFQDRRTTYYEVDASGMPMIENHSEYQRLVHYFEARWSFINSRVANNPQWLGRRPWVSPRANWNNVEFKFLVCQAPPRGNA